MTLNEIGRQIIHSGSHLQLGTIQFEGGKSYEFTQRVGGKNAVAGLVTHRENQTQIFIEQYRYPVKTRVLELVAGLLDKPGKTREQIMIEEIDEEIGYKKVNILECIGVTSGSAGKSSELTYLYDVEISGERGGQNLGDMEDIKIIEVPIIDVHKFLKSQSKNGVIISPNIGQALYLVGDKYRKIL